MANTIVFDPTIWQRNLQALERRDPKLAQRLNSIPLPERFIAARAGNGAPVLGVVLENGQSAALCHTEHPQREAEQWVRGLGEALRRSAHVLLVGFGAGYHPLALFRQSDADSWIWIVEPDAALLKAAFHLGDYTELIGSQRIRFAVGLPEKETAKLLFTGQFGNRMRAQGIRMAFTGVSRHLYAEYIQRLNEAIQEAIQMEGLKFKTSELQGESILKNIMGNLPHILQGAPWKRLIGAAPGVPAFAIAPGPSLEDALPFLARYRNNALYIAVDTAHRILHRHGIVSDLVACLDFTDLNARHFETIHEDPAILLAFPGIHPSISERYPGRAYFYNHSGSVDFGPGATQLLKSLESLGGLGDLVSYGSTAHIAVHAARMMGCSPIILIGNDLAFPNARWYAAGAMQNELHQPERETEPLLTVESNDGGAAQTSGLYKHYLDTFTELIRGSAAPVINTSPQGARIAGAGWMPLPEALSTFCVHSVDSSFLERGLKPNLATRSKSIRDELTQLTESCVRSLRRLRRLSDRLDTINPGAVTFRQDMIRIIKSFSDILLDEQKTVNSSLALCYRSTLTILGGSGQTALFGSGDPKDNQQARERCAGFFNDLEKALRINAGYMKEAVKKLSLP